MTSSWGNNPKLQAKRELVWYWQDQNNLFETQPCLAFGQGRSYGDSCLNENGALIHTKHLNRFIEFDRVSGVLRCEAGLTLSTILELVIPCGWILPVMPGTQYVSVGGAIANDVHGKNHHKLGSFGHHVKQFELLRSDKQRLVCSYESNKDLYLATIGGLGLTGLITWAEIQLKKIPSEFLEVESICFSSLEEFLDLSKASEKDYEYTVAWLDCQAKNNDFGRGIFMRANFVETNAKPSKKKHALRMPFFFPGFILNPISIKLFNWLYYYKAKWGKPKKIIHYQPFFFPLDSIGSWNKIYGKRGFYQYQCVISPEHGLEGIKSLLDCIVKSKQGSFLSVLKTFGMHHSLGMLSFPKPGLTLALDFPNHGKKTLQLMEALDKIVLEHGGKVYLAKDARMSEYTFKQYYPNWQEFNSFIDPAFSSSLWRRVTGKQYGK